MDTLPPLQDAAKPIGDRAPKARKTVLGLFEDPTSSSTPSHYAASTSDYTDPQSSPSFAPDTSFESERSTDLDRGEEENASRMPSLGSELGLQLQDLSPAPAHARSKSIMELLLMDANSPLGTIAPSTSTSTLTSNMKKAAKGDGKENFALDERIGYPRLRRTKDDDASSLTPTSTTKSPLFSHPTQSPFAAASASSTRSVRAPAAPPSPRQPQNKLDKLQALLIELWLWMHFAAVIAVFIFTMARMGPKVFFDAPGAPVRARRTSTRNH